MKRWRAAVTAVLSTALGNCRSLHCCLQVSLLQDVIPALDAVLAASQQFLNQAEADPGPPARFGCELVLPHACALLEVLAGGCVKKARGQLTTVLLSSLSPGAVCCCCASSSIIHLLQLPTHHMHTQLPISDPAAQGESLLLFNWLMGVLPLLTSRLDGGSPAAEQGLQPPAGTAAPGVLPRPPSPACTEVLTRSFRFLRGALTRCLLHAACQPALQHQQEQVWQLLLPAAEQAADRMQRRAEGACCVQAEDDVFWTVTSIVAILGEGELRCVETCIEPTRIFQICGMASSPTCCQNSELTWCVPTSLRCRHIPAQRWQQRPE